MKYILSSFFFLFVSICLSQRIDYSHFSYELMNKAMIKEFNEFRRSIGVDTLVYSDELFKTISKPNCVEVSSSGGFYHPSLIDKWHGTDIKSRIAKESLLKIGGTLKLNGDGSFWMDVHENAFRTTKRFETYEELAEFAIYSWSISDKGHREIQMMSYMTVGLPGMFSCHSEFASNGYVYIYINFVKIRRS